MVGAELKFANSGKKVMRRLQSGQKRMDIQKN